MTDTTPHAVEIDGIRHATDSLTISVAQVLALAGRNELAIVVRISGGTASLVSPDDEIVITGVGALRLRTFPEGEVRWLRVGGVTWDWAADAIREEDIRTVAGLTADDRLVAEDTGTPIPRGSMLDLTGRWPLRLRVESHGSEHVGAPAPAEQVSIVVNGRPTQIASRELTFEDLVLLAFPGVNPLSTGARSLTVTYRRGPADRPEGSLVSRENVRVMQGEVFSVTATDKS